MRPLAEEPILGLRVEELAERFPEVVQLLLKKGVRCIRCGEPVWGTLGKVLDESGISDKESLLREIKALLGAGEVP